MPEISVIVPVYKVEPYLHRCVDSILAQTFRDFELILVDDGSPDSCGAICEEYARKDGRIHVIHQENGGLSAARNTGIDWSFANSDSQWLTFVDSDDWVHPELLGRLLSAAIENDVNISVCGFQETTGEEPGISTEDYAVKVWDVEDFYLSDDTLPVIAWGKLYRKECFQSIRYPKGKLHEDEYTTHSLIFPEKKVAVCVAPMYFYFQNTGGITKAKWSPKRMDAAEGTYVQALYLKHTSFHDAYRHAAEKNLYTIKKQISKIVESDLPDNDRKRYIHKMRMLYKKALWSYRDLYGYKGIVWIYMNHMHPEFLKWFRK